MTRSRKPTEAEREALRKEATPILLSGEPYTKGWTRITPVGSSFTVEHGVGGHRKPWVFHTASLPEALDRFAWWRGRPCTSCGQPGCAQDLVGKAWLIDLIPPPQAVADA